MIRPKLRGLVNEIESSFLLRCLGAFLSLTNLAFGYFLYSQDLLSQVRSQLDRVCWHFLPNCQAWVIPAWVPVEQFDFLFGIGGVVGAVLFLKLRSVWWAWALLLSMTVLKHGVILWSFEHMGNYHYMPIIASYAYLALPNKRDTHLLLVLVFYLGASLLKFNLEWLSGSALWKPRWPIAVPLIQLGCFYVVFLESVLVFGLFHARRWIRYAVFAQLLLFHAMSYVWVGWYYPTIMGLLIVIFPFAWRLEADSAQALKRFVTGSLPRSSTAAVICLIAVQFLPWLVSRDPARSGIGRTYSLNMIDAQMVCQNHIEIVYDGLTVDATSGGRYEYAPRLRCDPMALFSRLRNICSSSDSKPLMVNAISVSKRTSDSQYRPLLKIEDACNKDLYQDFLGRNPGIIDQ